MAVDTASIDALYNSLMNSVSTRYKQMWDDNEIDAETYSKLLGQASVEMMNIAVTTVQKQETIDAEVAITNAQLPKVKAEVAVAETQILIADTEASIKKTQEANIIKEGLLLDEQVKEAYVNRVIKDKEAARAGLDDAMGMAEAARNGSTVYTPTYKES